jgi:hypothetical protein
MANKIRKAYRKHDLAQFTGTDSGVDGASRYSAPVTGLEFGDGTSSQSSLQLLLEWLQPGTANAINAFPPAVYGTVDEAKTAIAFHSDAFDWTIPSSTTWELLDSGKAVAFTATFASASDQTTFMNTVAAKDADLSTGKYTFISYGSYADPSLDKFNWS